VQVLWKNCCRYSSHEHRIVTVT